MKSHLKEQGTESSSERNVLMVIPNLNFGGAQRSFNNLANELAKKYNVWVCVFNTEDGIAFDYSPKIIDLKIPGGKNAFTKVYYFIQRYRAIKRLKQQLFIDTSISYLEGANYLNALTNKGNSVILSVRGSKQFDPNISGFLGWLRTKVFIPLLYRRADAVVALNEGIKRELTMGMGLVADRVVVIRNFYDIKEVKKLSNFPVPDQFNEILNSKYLIYSGRMAPEKGLFTIIDCYKLILTHLPDLKLVLQGDGPIQQDLVVYGKKLGLRVSTGSTKDAQLTITGYQENPYILLKNASALLLASRAEGGPNILIESMICNTLVISVDCPYGPAEILMAEHGGGSVETSIEATYGVLLPVIHPTRPQNSLKEWANTIERYIKDDVKTKEIVERASKSLMNYTPENIVPYWEQVIERKY